MTPPVWMISITDNPISQHYKDKCLPTWQKKGYRVNHFEAITPETMKGMTDLNFYKKIKRDRSEVEFTETEKAVWYSHYLLWKNCVKLDKPIIVIEHDAYMYEGIDESRYKTTQFAFMCHKITPEGIMGMLPCGAYYITPRIAKMLIRNVSNNITINVDGYVRMFIEHAAKKGDLHYKVWKYLAGQIIDEIGTTIEHKKS